MGGDLAALADQLDTISSVDGSDDLGAMAYIMTAVAVQVFKGAPIISAPAVDKKVNALTWKMRTELSVECAIYFAQIQGYQISPAQVDREQITRVMLMDDLWEPLVTLFGDSLVAASLIDDASSKVPTNRQLSTESYANLRSQAFQRGWTEVNILMLIEEHLRPKLNPSAVHYSDTVSGEEWVDLYNWVHRRDGRPLWRSATRSSLK